MSALAATPQDVAAGWVLVGIFLGVIGAVVVGFGRSEVAERRAQRASESARTELRATPEYQLAWEQHVADALAATEAAAVVPLPIRLRSVPAQRKAAE